MVFVYDGLSDVWARCVTELEFDALMRKVQEILDDIRK